ncbi:MAG TPA: hypothetical protein VL282_10270 [Tepidisphaeraceae bacterium]|nr:hypothetical protein [Tepidisphaeraceae bacterium]
MLRPLALALLLIASHASAALTRFSPSPYFNEQIREQKLPIGVRIVTNAAGDFDAKKPTELIFYALPNGNTIEQTIGCAEAPGLDWHFYIQHIGAQTRKLREVTPDRNIVVAYLEAEGKSWPGWRKARKDNPALIHKIVDDLAKDFPNAKITLSAHSGGGSFITGFINGADAIDPRVERIAYLDANYSYDDETDHHGDKLIAWLRGDKNRHLIVICYDDRNITYQGKLVVSPTGGTFRATHRMLDRFGKEDNGFVQTVDDEGTIEKYWACNQQAAFFLHHNPENKILHTVLVGEMSGFLHAMTLGTAEEGKWGTFAGPVSYKQWIQPAPKTSATTKATTSPVADQAPPAFDVSIPFPPRTKDAAGGHDVMKRVADLAPKDREEQLIKELVGGNVPDFMRHGIAISAEAHGHRIVYVVSPDYLAVGSNDDFVRVPFTPGAAQKAIDAVKCSLPTRKMVNDIYTRAAVKLEPQPMTEKREAVTTFVEQNDLIESKRPKNQTGELIGGIKKDIVITNRLLEKPNRVAIYGWHKLDGNAIQPLTIVHGNFYVDYSHGIRLVKQDVLVDGKAMRLEDVLKDETLSLLVSDEGPLAILRY